MNGNSANADQINISLGARIRLLRNDRKLKITDLAKLTGLTSSTISQVERALISPSIATLKKICNAMNMPIGYLFEDVDDGTPPPPIPAREEMDVESYINASPQVKLGGLSPVVHKENRKFLSPGKGIRFYLLTPNMAGPIELIYNEYDPNTSTGPSLYTHPGSECGLILSGELVVQINDEEYVLKEEDSITFNSSDPHLKKNVSNTMCTCIWANVPPWF